MLQEIILKETKGGRLLRSPDDSVTFHWFVKGRHVPMRRGLWSPTYKDQQLQPGALPDWTLWRDVTPES
jgi:hypothetical protein